MIIILYICSSFFLLRELRLDFMGAPNGPRSSQWCTCFASTLLQYQGLPNHSLYLFTVWCILACLKQEQNGQNTGSPIILYMVIISKGTYGPVVLSDCSGVSLGMLAQHVPYHCDRPSCCMASSAEVVKQCTISYILQTNCQQGSRWDPSDCWIPNPPSKLDTHTPQRAPRYYPNNKTGIALKSPIGNNVEDHIMVVPLPTFPPILYGLSIRNGTYHAVDAVPAGLHSTCCYQIGLGQTDMCADSQELAYLSLVQFTYFWCYHPQK